MWGNWGWLNFSSEQGCRRLTATRATSPQMWSWSLRWGRGKTHRTRLPKRCWGFVDKDQLQLRAGVMLHSSWVGVCWRSSREGRHGFLSWNPCLGCAGDARKMLPESGFLFTELKNELREHTGSKQAKVFLTGKQRAPSTDPGRGRKSPPSYCSWGFYFFNLFFFFLFFFFLGLDLQHMEVPRPGGQAERQLPAAAEPQPQPHRIQATSVAYTTAQGNARSLTHWPRPGIEPATLWFLVRCVSTAPRREYQHGAQISGFSPWPCPVYTSVFVHRALRGGSTPEALWFLCSSLP